jgi:hypothetical protein
MNPQVSHVIPSLQGFRIKFLCISCHLSHACYIPHPSLPCFDHIYIHKTLRYISVQGSAVSGLQERNNLLTQNLSCNMSYDTKYCWRQITKPIPSIVAVVQHVIRYQVLLAAYYKADTKYCCCRVTCYTIPSIVGGILQSRYQVLLLLCNMLYDTKYCWSHKVQLFQMLIVFYWIINKMRWYLINNLYDLLERRVLRRVQLVNNILWTVLHIMNVAIAISPLFFR